jgi:RsmE family RNA methyltransferase
VNLLLLGDEDFQPDGTVRLEGRRARHAREVLRATVGDVLRVGRRGGQLGEARVLAQTTERLHLEVRLELAPPSRPGIDLLLAIPRPKQLKRVIPAVASLGVDTLVLVNAARVEKSYFDSKVLAPAFLDELICQGLEQARDTISPRILVRDRFRPFVEDELGPLFAQASHRWVAHPGAQDTLCALPPPTPADRVLLAVGPEGGWVPFELELLAAHGFRPFSMGPRILRTETAVPHLVGQLALLRECQRANRP